MPVRAAIVHTPLGPPHDVVVADLLGRSPDAVREALVGAPTSWPLRYALETTEPGGGERAYTLMNEMLQDAAAQEIVDRGRTGGGDLPTEWSQCAVKRADDTDASAVDDVYTSLLEFRQGRLAAIWLGSLPKGAVLAGNLQVDDGAGFPSDAGLTALPATAHVTVACSRHSAEAAPPRKAPAADYNWAQALALLPLAPALPFKNGGRSAAKRDGGALYDLLAPGSTPPADLIVSAERRRLVQKQPSGAPDLALLRIDLGAYPGRNLTAPDNYGLVGLRSGRVAWRLREPGGW